MKSDLQELKETVIDGGYCVGCGVCSVLKNSPISMKLDNYGKFQAHIPEEIDISTDKGKYQEVCPFSNKSNNENIIGKEWFGEQPQFHEKLGYFHSTFAGYVEEGNFRENGSSGGLGTWLGYTLLKSGQVDGIIHVHKKEYSELDPRLFQFNVSTTLEEVIEHSKSRYYPVEMSDILKKIKEMPGRYVIIGVPCFVKAIRLLQGQDAIYKEKIAFCIALICGHLKSARFAEMFGWQCGIKPHNLRSIDFRAKLNNKRANQYGVRVTGISNGKSVEVISQPVNELYGTNWGHGFFKYRSCDYCDDVVGETADITIGDAWLPKYVNDSKGTNVIVVRNQKLINLLKIAKENGTVILEDLTADEVVFSQQSGFNHRHEGLSYRLKKDDEKKIWRPEKRIKAAISNPKASLQKKQDLRSQLAAKSHIAFDLAIRQDSFQVFKDEMNPILSRYERLYEVSWGRKLAKKAYKYIIKILKR